MSRSGLRKQSLWNLPPHKDVLVGVIQFDADVSEVSQRERLSTFENKSKDVSDVVFLNKQGFEKVEPEFVVHPVLYKYANLHMYTDIQP